MDDEKICDSVIEQVTKVHKLESELNAKNKEIEECHMKIDAMRYACIRKGRCLKFLHDKRRNTVTADILPIALNTERLSQITKEDIELISTLYSRYILPKEEYLKDEGLLDVDFIHFEIAGTNIYFRKIKELDISVMRIEGQFNHEIMLASKDFNSNEIYVVFNKYSIDVIFDTLQKDLGDLYDEEIE